MAKHTEWMALFSRASCFTLFKGYSQMFSSNRIVACHGTPCVLFVMSQKLDPTTHFCPPPSNMRTTRHLLEQEAQNKFLGG